MRSFLLVRELAVRLRSLCDAIEQSRIHCNVVSDDVRIVDDVLQSRGILFSSEAREGELPRPSVVSARVSSIDRRVRRGTSKGDDSFNLNINQIDGLRKSLDFLPIRQGIGIDATSEDFGVVVFQIHFFVDHITRCERCLRFFNLHVTVIFISRMIGGNDIHFVDTYLLLSDRVIPETEPCRREESVYAP
jgi:hypothetical protein